ncbi:hypothetical protein LC048_18405 [Mesobacillus subterraneus]|uniref:hypothetical protein n=1 Tax=Mesobacillus subterraneus TaxID=285983 RepID=UPI001CFCEC54|nr:hypothetical protein [Mesobacillus subterraneus]WLR54391.1 hypothetical protein LC048_18405 [Mesobacillus subterraneus]
MFYHDYQVLAQLKQLEVERKARHAWKFFKQPKKKRSPTPARPQNPQPKCCAVPANC